MFKWKATNLQSQKEWNLQMQLSLKLNKDEIKFEDFDKVEIKAAEVKAACLVENLISCFNSA